MGDLATMYEFLKQTPTSASRAADAKRVAPSSSSTRTFQCHFCHRKFYSRQALAGHWNVHKLERAAARRRTNNTNNNVNHHFHHNANNNKNVSLSPPPPPLPLDSSQKLIKPKPIAAIFAIGLFHHSYWLELVPLQFHTHHHHVATTLPLPFTASGSTSTSSQHAPSHNASPQLVDASDHVNLDLTLRL